MCSLRTNASRASGNVGNLLVDALPAPERDRLLDGAQHEVLPLRRVLFEPDQHLRKAYFPLGGVVSLVTPMLDGSAVEMATIGREGVVGVPALLEGGLPAGSRAVSQVQGEALSISAEAFRREVAAGGRLASLVHGFMQALFTLVGRNAACNRLHYMEQRCARWLLMTHDRVASDEFKLTQEFLAQMLGSRRASVTEAAAELQRSGAIRYQRGTITVINREALEASACECYAVIRRVFDSLYPPD